jgi:glycosyltransferase involved in cell wall biosynthesis
MTQSLRTSQQIKLAICAPVFNEEQGIHTFLRAVDEAVAELTRIDVGVKASLILADDGSRDATVEKISEFKFTHLHAISVHQLSRNFGHASAVSALLEQAHQFDAVMLMDADMQDEPSALPLLFSFWRDGFDSVRVVRAKRGEGAFFGFLSRTFYKMFRKLSNLESGLGNFGLYDRAVVEAVLQYPERARYWPGIITLAGFRSKLVPLDRNARSHGDSRVGIKGLFRLAMVALFSFSTVPIQIMGLFGMVIAVVSALAGVTVATLRLGFDIGIPGWASYLSVQFFFGGLIIFCLGIIGQYVGIIFEEVKARPRYFIRNSIHLAQGRADSATHPKRAG